MSPILLAITFALSPNDLPPSDQLAQAFNAAKGKVRIVMLVSPT
jgi:hypothetical protein